MTTDRNDDTGRWAPEEGAGPPPGQEQKPPAGTTVGPDEPAPQEVGESG